MALAELPRFWLFAELFGHNDPVQFDSPRELAVNRKPVSCPSLEHNLSHARRLCPGLYAYCCQVQPIRITLCAARHESVWVIGHVYAMPDGGSRVVYEHASYTRIDRQWQRKTAIAKYVRGQDVKLPEKLAAMLPRLQEGSLARKVYIAFDQRGHVISEGNEPLDPPPSRLYRTDSPSVTESLRNPILPCHKAWEPAKRILRLANMLYEELQVFGRFWLRPHAFRESDGMLTARLCIVAEQGDSLVVSAGGEEYPPRFSHTVSEILSWAASTVSIRGPGF
jgi:hypothetical protein